MPKVNCMVVTNLTKAYMESPEFPYARNAIFKSLVGKDSGPVQEGVKLGTILGKKLQMREESRVTIFNRLLKGKFDKRRASDLWFDSERVFYNIQTDKFKSVHMHISVDASSSMSEGEKWNKTMTAIVAMAKAASMVQNLGVTISFRSGIQTGKKNMLTPTMMPYIIIAYDSRKDKFSKILQLFPYIYPKGSTPEGLTFQAILDHIPPTGPDLDSYFVNLSDGVPMFENNYFGEIAHNHTAKQVRKIKNRGVEVISYFISTSSLEKNGLLARMLLNSKRRQAGLEELKEDENAENPCMAPFRAMYGKDSQFVDVSNVTEIAKTMNKKFLSSENRY